MKVKFQLDKSDIDKGFEDINDYSPVNLKDYQDIKDEVLEAKKCNKVDIDSLAINVYAEGLNLPTYIREDIYEKVENLIQVKYPFLSDYIGDMALIAAFLERYGEFNSVWKEQFHKQLQLHHQAISEAKKFFSNIQCEKLNINKIAIDCYVDGKPNTFDISDPVLMKILLNGFAKELYANYLAENNWREHIIEPQEYNGKNGTQDEDHNKVQNLFYAPMLRVYYGMLFNEGLVEKFSSKTAIKLFFGCLGEIAGAFVYTPEIAVSDAEMRQAITEEEKAQLQKKIHNKERRLIHKSLVARVESMCKIYLKQTGIDVTVEPFIATLPSFCSLRDYIICNHISVEKLKSVDYVSALVEVDKQYLYDKKRLDALFN